MLKTAEEAAYCTRRIARATALALAATDSCARASHVGMAHAYGERLRALMPKSPLMSPWNRPILNIE